MMRPGKTENLSGYRAPTPGEIRAVSLLFEKYYASGIRLCKVATTALCSLGLMLFCLYGALGWKAIVFGLLSYMGAFFSIASKNRLRRNQRVFADGRFAVLDGYVCKIGANDAPGCCNVWFESVNGQRPEVPFRVRQEGLQERTPLLLVRVEEREIRHGLTWVFTPFMLTEEARNLRW